MTLCNRRLAQGERGIDQKYPVSGEGGAAARTRGRSDPPPYTIDSAIQQENERCADKTRTPPWPECHGTLSQEMRNTNLDECAGVLDLDEMLGRRAHDSKSVRI